MWKTVASWTKHENKPHAHLTHLLTSSFPHVCYEPHPRTSAVSASHPISDTLLSSLHSSSQAATLPNTSSRSKSQVFFKARCHIDYLSLFYLIMKQYYNFYLVFFFYVSVMKFLSYIPLAPFFHKSPIVFSCVILHRRAIFRNSDVML